MNLLKIFCLLLNVSFLGTLKAQVCPVVNMGTGGIDSIYIVGDDAKMNWIVSTERNQYAWIGAEWKWGLGRLTIIDGKDSLRLSWPQKERMIDVVSDTDGRMVRSKVQYPLTDDILLEVYRYMRDGHFEEEYRFVNRGKKPYRLVDIEINTPFNDNYPDAETCVERRCHAHIWPGGHAAYVCALRMGAKAPHIGLMVTQGAIKDYVIHERDGKKGSSNTRGIIALRPVDIDLNPSVGKSSSLRWQIFEHQGMDDFEMQMLNLGGTLMTADRYVAEVGDTITLTLQSGDKKAAPRYIEVDGMQIKMKREKGCWQASYVVSRPGLIELTAHYKKESSTRVEVRAYSNIEAMIAHRADFIVERQQYDAPSDPRHGAYLPYDNETESQYYNWQAERKRSDLSEGRERLGMGVFLAMQYRVTPSQSLRSSLMRYAHFVRTQLQEPDYRTWSEVNRGGKHRIYNYPWVARFYFEMFQSFGDRQYLVDAYKTLRSMYHLAGYNFYAIEVPVSQSIRLLREHGMSAEADSLLGDFHRAAQCYLNNGLNFPKFEVNYEQSIVAPAVNFLAEMYLVTQSRKYLDAVEQMMPVLETFNGRQPSSHLHDVAIRHWDGYWFGKRRLWGDTFPHYWSCITADAFAHYSLCIGKKEYMDRALSILKANLTLITEEGRGSCAFLYPASVNKETAGCLDPMANDQDWALVYWRRWVTHE